MTRELAALGPESGDGSGSRCRTDDAGDGTSGRNARMDGDGEIADRRDIDDSGRLIGVCGSTGAREAETG